MYSVVIAGYGWVIDSEGINSWRNTSAFKWTGAIACLEFIIHSPSFSFSLPSWKMQSMPQTKFHFNWIKCYMVAWKWWPWGGKENPMLYRGGPTATGGWCPMGVSAWQPGRAHGWLCPCLERLWSWRQVCCDGRLQDFVLQAITACLGMGFRLQQRAAHRRWLKPLQELGKASRRQEAEGSKQ